WDVAQLSCIESFHHFSRLHFFILLCLFPVLQVDDNKKLGEWVGLCKIDREGKPRKVVGCSCVVIKDYGKESQAKDVIEEYFKAKK
uniref:Ribosomal protein S12 n=1 Tax=Hucho hucho TaxID=62062 RepID=A0A4W5JYK2_9TELE